MEKHKKFMFLPCIIVVLIAFNTFTNPVSLVSDTRGEITLNFTVPEYSLRKVNADGKIFIYVSVRGAPYLEKKGYAALPYFTQSVMIPDKAAMGVEIVDVTYKEIKVAERLMPSKGVLYRNQDPSEIPCVVDPSSLVDAWYPGKVVSLDSPYILRHIRGIVVRFQPFQYNPVAGVIKVAESMTVKVKVIGTSTENILTKKVSSVDESFNKVYSHHFLNYKVNRSRYDPVPDGSKMIVICPSNFENTIAPFIEWKNKVGIQTELCKYPDETGSGSSALKSFIQGKYDDEHITYVLLVGENNDVPAMSAGGGVSDPSYILLAGSDKYPDAFIGRFCSSQASTIEVMVNKVIKYESDPDENGEWYHKGMGIASSQGNPSDKEWVDDMRDMMMAYNYTEVDRIYDPGASDDDVTEGLNDGRTWVNYMGHGGKTSWSTTGFSNSDVNYLSNGDRLPVIISVACYNGQFASGTCFGEAWLNKSGGGAIANLSSSISQAWTPPQHAQKEMVRVLCEDLYISVGGIIYNGECKMLDNGNDQNTFVTWILFGEPSLLVRTDTPKKVTVTVPEAVEEGNQVIDVSLSVAIDGRVGIVGEKNGFLGCAVLEGRPDVKVEVEVPSGESELELTVFGRNVMPVTKTITVGQTNIVANIAKQDKIMVKHAPNALAIKTPNADMHTVSIWNVNGKKVASFDVTGAGKWHTVKQPVASGLHFITIGSKGEKVTQKYYFVK